jgi:hypothetical protein
LAASIVTEQAPAPEQAPLQPTKKKRGSGVGVRATTVAPGNVNEQVAPQSIPAGALVTLPVPLPDFVTESPKLPRLKVAVTALAAFIVTEQAPVPEHAPLQPANTEPGEALLVSETTVPDTKSWLHVPPQLIPAGLLVTVPAPVPALLTVKANFGGGGVPTLIVFAHAPCWPPLVTVTTALKVPLAV